MWWEYLLWGLAGGVCIEVWQAVARGLFQGRGSWSGARFPTELFAGALRLFFASWAGLLIGLPLDDPPPAAPILGGALAPLLLQDVVRRSRLRSLTGPAGPTSADRGRTPSARTPATGSDGTVAEATGGQDPAPDRVGPHSPDDATTASAPTEAGDEG